MRRSKPEDDGSERQHRKEVTRAPLEPSREATVLFQVARQTLNAVPLPLEHRIKAMPAVQGTLIAPTRDHRAQTPVGSRRQIGG